MQVDGFLSIVWRVTLRSGKQMETESLEKKAGYFKSRGKSRSVSGMSTIIISSEVKLDGEAGGVPKRSTNSLGM